MRRRYSISPTHPASHNFGLRMIPIFLVMSAFFSAETAHSQSPSGVEGVVTVSPIRPGPIRLGDERPNRAPFADATFIVRREKVTVTSFKTDERGRFRVSLAPGHYTVSPEQQGGPGHCGPFDVDVGAGKMTSVEWHCDSGMR